MTSRCGRVIALIILGFVATGARAQTISTYAGGGPLHTPALDTALGSLVGGAVASDGSVFLAMQAAVYRLDNASGTVSRVAGTGVQGDSGDGGPAISANVSVNAIALDAAGNIYLSDPAFSVIRRIDATTGIITTVAGDGTYGYSGDGGPATSAQLNSPSAVTVDGPGNLYIADEGNYVIRRVDVATKTITTVAGNGTYGYSGDGGPATDAQFLPVNVTADAAGNLYITDINACVVRRVDATTNVITTVAGNGTRGYSGDGTPASMAQLFAPLAATLDAVGNLYIADQGNYVIRRVDAATGVITTVAGNGTYGSTGDGGPATSAQLYPFSVASDANGDLYIADTNHLIVRRVDGSAATITTVVGNGTYTYGGTNGQATAAQMGYVFGVAADALGDLYVADETNAAIRRVDALSGMIATVAGNGSPGYEGDGGPAASAQLAYPYGVALDTAGNLYIADTGNHVIRRVDASTGTISTVAGNGTEGYAGDGGPATAAQMYGAYSVAVDASGNLYIPDTVDAVVRRIDAKTQVITTVAGNGTSGYTGDGGAATNAQLFQPTGLATNVAGDLFIADSVNNVIRRVDAKTQVITTFAGTGTRGYSGDGGPATSAQFYGPNAIALDGAGNLYIADLGNNVVRRIDTTTGVITTVAGDSVYGYSGDGGPATSGELANPFAVALSLAGDLFVADSGNMRVRKVPGVATPFDSTPPAISAAVSGTMGRNGWYVSNVSVTWSVTDPESTVTSKIGCDPVTIAVDTAGQTLTCTATSAGGTGSKSVTIKRDATPPTASYDQEPMPNSQGWNNATVSVTFSGVDGTSGIAQCSPEVDLVAEGAGQQASGTCTDNAGNVSAPVTATNINIDETPPTVSGVRTPPPNAAGWNNTQVDLTVSGTDALSGIQFCQGAQKALNGAVNFTLKGTCTDKAGNVGSFQVTGINVDTIPPTATTALNPPANANGWNNTPVTVTVSGTDSIPGSGIASCTGGASFTKNVSGQQVTGTCTDVAGNQSNPVTATVNVDLTAPKVTLTRPANGATYNQGAVVTASFSCTDASSGIDTCIGTVAKGAAISTGTPGTQTFTVIGTDLAGNVTSASASYTVIGGAPPVVTPVVSGTVGNNGWYTSDVSLSWNITSAFPVTSKTGCGAVSITSDTKGVTHTCTAVNSVGSGSNTVTIQRDATAPTVKAKATPAPNAAGWNDTAVSVAFTGTDAISGIATCSGITTLQSEGVNQSTSGTCTNNAGLLGTASATGINIDLTAPTVAISVPTDGATYAKGSTVAASFTCSDAGSGISKCTGTVANGAAINTASKGSKSFAVTATDVSGLTTKSTYTYTVQ